jgi:lipid II:glycine glycyltransferase (peptidoglycan interpeptide bridge formation enzyme)
MPAIYAMDSGLENVHALRFYEADELAACAIGLATRPRRLRRLIGGESSFTLPTAPALASKEHARSVRKALFEYTRSAGFERMHVNAAGSRSMIDDLELAAYRTESILEFEIDLQRDLETISAAMHKTHRKNIRRAAKQDLRVERDESLEGLLRLRDMQLSSSERATRKTEGFGVDERASFERLHDQVYSKGLGRVLFAYQGDEAIAALAWLSAANRAVTVRSGSTAQGYQTRAMYLLYDELIRISHAEKLLQLNAGGVPSGAAESGHSQSGLYDFKLGFGGNMIERFGLDIPMAAIQS